MGGRADILRKLSPLGPVYQAGTLSGNPVAVAAGLAMLELGRKENPYPRMEVLGHTLTHGLNDMAREVGVTLHCTGLGGMFTPFFMAEAPTDLASVKRCDTKAYATFFRQMLTRGFYLPPSQFEAAFISAAHTEADIARFLTAAREVLKNMSAY